MAIDIVTTNADSGAGSLRLTLANAAAGDTIEFSSGVFTGGAADDIVLGSALVITKNVTILGQVGGADVTLDGNGATTVLTTSAKSNLTLDNLVIQNGSGTGIDGSAASNTLAAGTGGGAAGGILNRGTLTLSGDSFINDTATGGAGGAGGNDLNYCRGGTGGYAAGAILNLGTLTLSNTQFSGNSATGGAGGSGGYYTGAGAGAGAGGGAGGNAAGAVYVAPTAHANLGAYIVFASDTATGGDGGAGGTGNYSNSGVSYRSTGGAGGAGGVNATGQAGYHGGYDNQSSVAFAYGGTGGAAGKPGGYGSGFANNSGYQGYGAGGGGGGGTGFTDIGGAGVACFVRGTAILTPGGAVPVEQLSTSDMALTLGGKAEPIRWIGRRSYHGRFLAGQRHLLPIRIRAGALGGGLPVRDLLVSPRHAMFLDGMLIPAEALVNGSSIVREHQAASVEYYHVELARHDVIWAEGAATESFVDDDSRAMFHNASEFARLYPDHSAQPARYCAPRLTDGYALEAVRTRLAGLAAA